MSEHAGARRFRLHMRGPGVEGHMLPASILVRALDRLQQTVYLLAKFRRGRPLGRRTGFPRDILSGFELACGISEEGGYAMPVEIGRRSILGPRVADGEAEKVADMFFNIIKTIGKGNAEQLHDLIPDIDYRVRVVENLRAAIPPRQTGVTFSIEDENNMPLFDGEFARDRIDSLMLFDGEKCEKTIEKREFTLYNIRYLADPPLRFHVNFDWRSRLYGLRGDFGIDLAAESRSGLDEALDSALDMLWNEYACENPERLSGDARALREALLRRIRETS